VEFFSQAIEEVKSDDEELHIIYSNRSFAYSKLENFDKALEDADKCISLKEDWAKGHARKGFALLELKDYSNAYNAYQRAIKLDPSSGNFKAGLNKAQVGISKTPQSSSSSSGWYGNSSSSSSSTSTSSSSSSSTSLFSFMKDHPIQALQFLTRVVVIVYFILFLIPFFTNPLSTSSTLLMAAALDYILALSLSVGFPQFNMQWATKAMADPSTQYLFLAVLLLFMRQPFLLPLFSIAVLSLAQVAQFVVSSPWLVPPSLLSPLEGPATTLMVNVTGNASWGSQSRSAKWSSVTTKALFFSCTSQVMQGVFLVVNLLLPSRSIIALFLYWQFLQLRYMLDQSGYVKSAFLVTDQRILGILSHQYCPSFLATGYGYIKGFLKSHVESRMNAGQGGGGGSSPSMFSRCTIS